VDEAGRTSEPELWAEGGMGRGSDGVSAVADGHRAAEGINEFLLVREQAA